MSERDLRAEVARLTRERDEARSQRDLAMTWGREAVEAMSAGTVRLWLGLDNERALRVRYERERASLCQERNEARGTVARLRDFVADVEERLLTIREDGETCGDAIERLRHECDAAHAALDDRTLEAERMRARADAGAAEADRARRERDAARDAMRALRHGLGQDDGPRRAAIAEADRVIAAWGGAQVPTALDDMRLSRDAWRDRALAAERERDEALAARESAPEPAAEPPADTRKSCTCVASCRGPEGLGEGWRCALGRWPAARPRLFDVWCNGHVHYTRPEGDPLLDEARSRPGYEVRPHVPPSQRADREPAAEPPHAVGDVWERDVEPERATTEAASALDGVVWARLRYANGDALSSPVAGHIKRGWRRVRCAAAAPRPVQVGDRVRVVRRGWCGSTLYEGDVGTLEQVDDSDPAYPYLVKAPGLSGGWDGGWVAAVERVEPSVRVLDEADDGRPA